jgi:hypothetical protein
VTDGVRRKAFREFQMCAQGVSLLTGFFHRNTKPKAEIIEGLLCDGQLAAFAGPFGVGKTPMIADLTVCLIRGIDWCGRKVEQRPVILVDCETAGPDYKRTVRDIAARYRVPTPRVPDDLQVFLEHDDLREGATRVLLEALGKPGHAPKLKLLGDALSEKPNAVVFVDPLEMLFRLDTVKKLEVMILYQCLRRLLAEFPQSALLGTFNLRKQDRAKGRANLLSDPRNWLEEVCGSLDLLNRCDVRLGIDIHPGNDELRVINGSRRGVEMHPLLIRSVLGGNDRPAGFEQVMPDQMDLMAALSKKQKLYWDQLAHEFKFEEVAGRTVPRSSLSRLLSRAKQFGAIEQKPDGTFTKRM